MLPICRSLEGGVESRVSTFKEETQVSRYIMCSSFPSVTNGAFARSPSTLKHHQILQSSDAPTNILEGKDSVYPIIRFNSSNMLPICRSLEGGVESSDTTFKEETQVSRYIMCSSFPSVTNDAFARSPSTLSAASTTIIYHQILQSANPLRCPYTHFGG